MENKDDEKTMMVRRAVFFVNLAFILADMANTAAGEASSRMAKLYGAMSKTDKYKFKLAASSAKKTASLTEEAAKYMYDLKDVGSACEDSDYLLTAIMLIIDRTDANEESKEIMLKKIRENPSVMKLSEWLDPTGLLEI